MGSEDWRASVPDKREGEKAYEDFLLKENYCHAKTWYRCIDIKAWTKQHRKCYQVQTDLTMRGKTSNRDKVLQR